MAAASSSKLPGNDLLSPPPSLQLPDPINRPQHLPPPASNSHEDLCLSMSSHLTRHELLRRRLHRIRRLSRVYRRHYWALMEDLRLQHREYYWKYGISPCKEDEGGGGTDYDREIGDQFNVEGCGETNNIGVGKLGLGFGEMEVKLGGNNRCTFVGCKLKAMALTSFCHLHILSDPHQSLYKACNFVIKSAQAGPILCRKPILRSTVPSLCHMHFQKAHQHVTCALKKAGLNAPSSSKLAPKFHVIMAEYVNQIQSKRRVARKANGKNIAIKEEESTN